MLLSHKKCRLGRARKACGALPQLARSAGDQGRDDVVDWPRLEQRLEVGEGHEEGLRLTATVLGRLRSARGVDSSAKMQRAGAAAVFAGSDRDSGPKNTLQQSSSSPSRQTRKVGCLHRILSLARVCSSVIWVV